MPNIITKRMSVAEVARTYGVGDDKVLAWIASGELRAINVATDRAARRPRYRITPEAVAAFESARATTAPALRDPRRLRRRQRAGDVIEFYPVGGGR